MKHIALLLLLASQSLADDFFVGFCDSNNLVVEWGYSHVSTARTPPAGLTFFAVPERNVDAPPANTVQAQANGTVSLWKIVGNTAQARAALAINQDLAVVLAKRERFRKACIQSRIIAIQKLQEAAPGDAGLQADLTEAQAQLNP